MKRAIPIIALSVAGCGGDAAPVASQITPPEARYMQPVGACPKTPEGIKVDKAGTIHITQLRNACADNREIATGLQKWAFTVTKKETK